MLKLHTRSNWADRYSHMAVSWSLDHCLWKQHFTTKMPLHAVTTRMEDYSIKLKGMSETSTYWRLGKDPTAAQENRLSRKLKEEKSGEIMKRLYNHHAGHLAVSHPECMVSPRSTYSRSHSEPLSCASDLLPTSSPGALCCWYPHWQAGLTHDQMWRTPGTLWKWWKTWGLRKMRCWSALTCPPCSWTESQDSAGRSLQVVEGQGIGWQNHAPFR